MVELQWLHNVKSTQVFVLSMGTAIPNQDIWAKIQDKIFFSDNSSLFSAEKV